MAYNIVPTSKSSLSNNRLRGLLELFKTYASQRLRTIHWNVTGGLVSSPLISILTPQYHWHPIKNALGFITEFFRPICGVGHASEFFPLTLASANMTPPTRTSLLFLQTHELLKSCCNDLNITHGGTQ